MFDRRRNGFPRQWAIAILFAVQAIAFGVFAFAPLAAEASIPTTLGYQGRLKNSSGTAQSGTFSFTFRIYAASSGGSALWTETQPSVSVDSGSFAVQLGSVTAFPVALDFNQPLYLTTEVNGDGEMSPRIALNSVPYAYTTGGISSLSVQPSSATGGRMFYNTGNGSLNYYDGVSSTWKSLRTTTGTLHEVASNGNSTTNALVFAGGTSTNNFDISGTVDNLLRTGMSFSGVTSTSIGSSPSQVVIAGKYAYTANAGDNTISIIDVTNVTAQNEISLIGTVGVPGTPVSIFVDGRYAYVSSFANNSISVLDVSRPSGPLLVSTVGVGVAPDFIFASGRYVYVPNSSDNTLSIVDVADPSNPVVVTSTSVGTQPVNVYVYGRYAYVTNKTSNTMSIVDVQNPAQPSTLSFSVGTSPTGIFVSGRFAYVVNQGNNTLSIIDVGDPTAPASVSTVAVGSTPSNVFVSGRYAYVTNKTDNTLSIIDVLEADTPVVLDTIPLKGTSPVGLAVAGQHVYVANSGSNNLSIFNIKGIETNGLFANSANLGSMQVLTNGRVDNNLAVGGSLFTGTGGIYTAGSLAVGASNVTSTFAFGLEADFGAFSTRLRLNGVNVCLADGTNCPTSTQTLASVTANGSSATTTLKLYGGFLAASSTVTSTLTVLGSTSLQGLSFTNGTSSNWFGFTTASGTTLNASSISVNGSAVCLANGTNCPASTDTDTFQSVTNRGNNTTTTVQLFGGFDAASSTVTSTLTVLGSTSLQGLSFTNGTSSNWFGFTTASGTTLNASSILVNGSAVCLANGTNCPAGIGTPSLAQVTAIGASATATLQLLGGFDAASSTVTSTFTVLGATSLQALTFTNGTSSNWFGFTTASGTTLNASSISVNGSAVCLANGTNCPAGIGTPSLAQVTAIGASATATLQLLGGFDAASSTVTSTFTVLGNTSLQALTFTVGTSTSVTTTNLAVTAGLSLPSNSVTDAEVVNGLTIDSTGSISATAINSGTLGNASVTLALGSFGSITGSLTDANVADALTISGGTINNSPIGASTASTGVFTSVTSTSVTSTNLFATNLIALTTNLTSLTVTGTTSLQALSFTNGTSSNWFGFTTASGTTINASSISVNGSAVCLANGTNCPAGSTDTLQSVTNRGNNTTTTVQLFGGFVGASSTVTSTFTVLGSTSLQGLTFTNGTSSNWFGFTTASGTTINASSISVNGSAVCLANGTNCPASGSQSLQAVTNVGSNTTNTLQLFGGFDAASSTVTSTFTVLGNTSLQALTFTNGTGTSVTTTDLNVTTYVRLPSNTQINSTSVCLADGTNCPAGIGTPTLAQVTAMGASTTSTLQLLGGFDAASSTVTSTFTVLGSTSLQGLTFTSGTGTSVTTTNLAVSSGINMTNTTATIQMGTSSTLQITDGTHTLLEVGHPSILFGGALQSGAFMDRNSTIQEEFNKARTTVTTDANGNNGAGMGDGGGWGSYENQNSGCSFSTLADGTNGVMRIGVVAAGSGCLTMIDRAAGTPQKILAAGNLPVILMKVEPSDVSSPSHFFYAGMGDSADGTVVAPTNFIGFANDGGSTWLARTYSGGTTSTVTCTGQTISTTAFALLKIEVRSTTDVHFFVDTDVTNGINFTECGAGITTNIPTVNLTPQIIWQVKTGGSTAAVFDTDYYRAWQDDPKGNKLRRDVAPVNVPVDFAAQSNVAEFFPADDLDVEPGTLVSLDASGGTPKVKPTESAADSNMVGVVVDDPGVTLTNGSFDGLRVATHGRAKVKASTENGPIKIGDALTSASVAGVAMKATGAGPMIGRAMENFFGATSGSVTMLVQSGYYLPSLDTASVSSLSSSATGTASALQAAGSTPEIHLPAGSKMAAGFGIGTLVARDASFTHSVVIEGTTTLRGPIVLGPRNAGRVNVPPQLARVRVSFKTPYPYPPHVFATPEIEDVSNGLGYDSSIWSGSFYLANVTTTGFDIRLPHGGVCATQYPCPVKLWFNWLVTGFEGETAASSTTPAVESAETPAAPSIEAPTTSAPGRAAPVSPSAILPKSTPDITIDQQGTAPSGTGAASATEPNQPVLETASPSDILPPANSGTPPSALLLDQVGGSANAHGNGNPPDHANGGGNPQGVGDHSKK